MTKQKAIYLKCLDCSGGSAKDVTLCTLFECPLWEYRCGFHVTSGRYAKRIEAAFSKLTPDIQELRREGLEGHFFNVERKQACSRTGEGKERTYGPQG